jgi:4-hydroxyphenylpyruvate dioxygenase-like putative hemolysin
MPHPHVAELREVSLAVPSLASAREAAAAIIGHSGYPVQHEPAAPVEASFQSFSIGGRSLALMESNGGQRTAITHYLSKWGAGPFSFTLSVDDLDSTTAHLRASGARVVLDEPMTMYDIRSGNQIFEQLKINFIAPGPKTHGLVIELQELHGGSTPEMPASTVGISALNEVHCAVTDLDAACRDLSELFGFDVGPLVVQDAPPEQVRFRNLAIGDRPALALITPSAPGTSIEKFLRRRGEGIFSVSLRVSDIDTYGRQLDAHRATLLLQQANEVKETRIGATIVDRARINWIKPTSTPLRTLFEIQEF